MTTLAYADSPNRQRELSILCPMCATAQPVVNDRAIVLGSSKPNLRVLACGTRALLGPGGAEWWFNFAAHRLTVIH